MLQYPFQFIIYGVGSDVITEDNKGKAIPATGCGGP
jgi:hypothetical protein